LESTAGALVWGAAGLGDRADGTLRLARELAALERLANTSPAPLSKTLAASLDRWLAESGNLADAADALESLAWAHGLAFLADRVERDAWQAALQKLVAQAEAADKSRHASLLVRQLAAGELPRTLGYWFPALEACQRLSAAGSAAALAALETGLDAEGVIHGKYLSSLRPLLASWTRMAAMEESSPKSERVVSAQSRFQRLVGQALRLSRDDGAQVFSPLDAAREPRESTAELFRAALRFAGEPQGRLAALAMPAAALKAKRPAKARVRKATSKTSQLPPAAFNSELSQLAVLRTGWASWEERLAVAYHEQQLAAELICGRDVVCSGTWSPEIEFDGARLAPESEWQEVCWVSDDDVDYLELEIFLSAGVRVQRHILLARQDHFLFVADAVLGEKPGAINYRSAMPLAPGVKFAAAKDSHEGQLIGRRNYGLVLPLALAEWRSEASPGALAVQNGRLELRQTASGAPRLFAPLFIDLAPRRFSRPYTWRRLTVAENRQIVPNESAVGYRVQVGGQQWLFYRSLGPRGNRTLLGHNLVTEFLAARFNRDGVAESLLEIE
jgi:hypothetical protein